LAAMLLSDALLDYGSGRPFITVSRLVIYATYVAIAVLGSLALRRGVKLWTLPLMSLGASTLFFLTSNFASWATQDLVPYPHTLAGFVACYVAAIPFFGNTVLADLAGTAVLFGLEALVLRARGWVGGAAQPGPLAEPTTPVD
jgi:hypothetical protein